MARFYRTNEVINLVPSAAYVGVTKSTTETTYGSGNYIADLSRAGPIQAIAFQLNMTAALKDAGDLLDVYVQMSFDGGTTYVDVVHFTQILGNTSGAKVYTAKIEQAGALTEFETGSALSAAAHRDAIGTMMRAKWEITNDSDNTVDTSFTFELNAVAM
jgi:hypothetical protein